MSDYNDSYNGSGGGGVYSPSDGQSGNFFSDLASAVPIVGSLVGAGVDIYNNNLNYQNQVAQQDYQRQLQQTMFQREDTAVQRRVADLRAAGLSPELAAGSAAEAGPVVASEAPQTQPMGQSTAQSLLASMQGAVQIQQAKANIAKTQADTDLVNQQIEQNKVTNPLTASSLSEGVTTQKINNAVLKATQDASVSQAWQNLDNSQQQGLLLKLQQQLGDQDVTAKKLANNLSSTTVGSNDTAFPAGLRGQRVDAVSKIVTLLAGYSSARMSQLDSNYFVSQGFSPAQAQVILNTVHSIAGTVGIFK